MGSEKDALLKTLLLTLCSWDVVMCPIMWSHSTICWLETLSSAGEQAGRQAQPPGTTTAGDVCWFPMMLCSSRRFHFIKISLSLLFATFIYFAAVTGRRTTFSHGIE